MLLMFFCDTTFSQKRGPRIKELIIRMLLRGPNNPGGDLFPYLSTILDFVVGAALHPVPLGWYCQTNQRVEI